MARTTIIPETEVTEEITGINHNPGRMLTFMVGKGAIKNGTFEFFSPQQFEIIEVKEGLYQKLISEHQSFTAGDLWEYVDMIRVGADKTRPSIYHNWDPMGKAWIEPADYLERLKADTVKRINNDTTAFIYAKYSQGKQSSMLARAVELQAIGQVESDEYKALDSAWQWIKGVVEKSNEAAAGIDALTIDTEIFAAGQAFKSELAQL